MTAKPETKFKVKLVESKNAQIKHMLGQKPFLIVPSIKCPPRVPKLLAAVVFGLDIIDFKWVSDSLAAKKVADLNDYRMEYQSVRLLFN